MASRFFKHLEENLYEETPETPDPLQDRYSYDALACRNLIFSILCSPVDKQRPASLVTLIPPRSVPVILYVYGSRGEVLVGCWRTPYAYGRPKTGNYPGQFLPELLMFSPLVGVGPRITFISSPQYRRYTIQEIYSVDMLYLLLYVISPIVWICYMRYTIQEIWHIHTIGDITYRRYNITTL